MDAALAELALDAPGRVLPYAQIAAHLGVPESDVEVVVLRVLVAGTVRGRVDAEHAHLVVDGTRPPAPTTVRVRQALAGLDCLESQLAGEPRPRKRSREVLDDPEF